ncbi:MULTISPECIES: hypothetical protein [Parachlamydia]|uniref:hypothetical protein n=1 Tax=Parachlamydia TaxID=83551 RepID=UPI001F49B098|nr:hypothetical protein [Parachlamydia acanthamoebae]
MMNTLASHINAYIQKAEVYEKEIIADENHLNNLLIQIFKDIESLKSSQANKKELYSLLNIAISKLSAEDMQKHKQQLFTQIVAAFNLDPAKIKKMDDLKDIVETIDKHSSTSTSALGVQQPHLIAAQPFPSYHSESTKSQPGVAQPHPQPASTE